jgi:MoxR-like ATPase
MSISDNVTNVCIKTAFASSHPDPATLGGQTKGYTGTQNHPCLPSINPTFEFDRNFLTLVNYAWSREFKRGEHQPRRGVWIGGPKGVGKTVGIEQFFARLGVPVTALTCNRRIPLSDYISKMVPDGEGGWLSVSGPLKVAMEEGFPVILNEPSLMDPADLVAMHDIIDRGLLVTDDGEVIRAARGFMVFATDNSMGYGDESGGYAGINTLNSATMSRFLKHSMGYPSKAREVSILQRIFPAQDEDVLEKFVDFANGLRAASQAGTSCVTMGTREVIEWAEAALAFKGLSARGVNPAAFALDAVMGGAPAEEREAMSNLFEASFGAKLEQAA